MELVIDLQESTILVFPLIFRRSIHHLPVPWLAMMNAVELLPRSYRPSLTHEINEIEDYTLPGDDDTVVVTRSCVTPRLCASRARLSKILPFIHFTGRADASDMRRAIDISPNNLAPLAILRS